MNPSLRILYLGDDHPHSTTRHRVETLKRIRGEMDIFNPWQAYAQPNEFSGFRLVYR